MGYTTKFRLGPVRWLFSAFSLIAVFGLYSCANNPSSSNDGPPEPNRFTTTIISEPGGLDEPMAFSFYNNSEMLIVERKGGVKALNIESRDIRQVGHIPVNTIYVNKEGQSRTAEEGLMGVAADPDYASNHRVYMLYADPDEAKHVLARWEFRDDSLYDNSKVVVLEYPAQREVCCHTGGGITFDKEGNLFLTTGNNTANPPSGTSNLDERPGFESADDQRTAGNTNDLRGKILRIHPEDDGSYSIPEGNLFAEGTPKTRPEIYTMGHRNPWRVSIDSQTGYIYWGEVGPDASEESERGPRGYDEFNQAKGPGFFGWPYFIGDNIPYTNFDYATEEVGPLFDTAHVENTSVNNTGLTELPAPQKAFIWYPYSFSEEFPLMGSAGRSATGGPVFRQADFPASVKRFPPYYEGKWLMVEFMRGWIMAITMDENGDFVSMEPFLPEEDFSSAIDMKFSPDGDLYVLEYGSAWFQGNDNAWVKRIEYNGGNRTPVVVASADKMAGALPLTVKLSSDGTEDYDKDKLGFIWKVSSDKGFSKELKGANSELTLDQVGNYNVELLVDDGHGNQNSQSFEIVAGNEPPKVDIDIMEGNRSFFFSGQPLKYAIKVSDKEDGKLGDGGIATEEVAVNFDYVPEGFDPIEIAQNHRSSEAWVSFSRGKSLIEGSDCLSCHRVDIRSIGPSYLEVAQKYNGNSGSKSLLANRIVKGSVGIWGEHAMSAHPDMSVQDAEFMVDYIMSLNQPGTFSGPIPLNGTYVPQVPEGQNGKGGYLLRAAYTDKGANGLEPLTSERIFALRNPLVDAEHHDLSKGSLLMTTPGRSFYLKEDGGYIAFKDLDLSGVHELIIFADAPGRVDAVGGVLELRLDDPEGALIGSSEEVKALEVDLRAETAKLRDAWEKGGKKGPEPNFMMVRNMFRPKYPVPLAEPVEGMHDLYIVVRNGEAQQGQILVQLSEVEFRNQPSEALGSLK